MYERGGNGGLYQSQRHILPFRFHDEQNTRHQNESRQSVAYHQRRQSGWRCRLVQVEQKTGIINANYNTSVRNRIAAKLGVALSEVEYQNGEVYYEHLQTNEGKNLPLVQHKDETKRDGLMLQYYPQKSTNCYVTAQGDIVPDAEVEKYLYAQSERSEFKPTVIGIKLKNILRLVASGIVMEAEDYEEAAQQLESATA